MAALLVAQSIFSQDIFRPSNINELSERKTAYSYANNPILEQLRMRAICSKLFLPKNNTLLFNRYTMQGKNQDSNEDSAPPVDPGNMAVQMDQDFLFRFPFGKNEDRNYTQGTAFTYSHPELLNSIFFWPLRKIVHKKNKENKSPIDLNDSVIIIPDDNSPLVYDYASSLSVGATAFTPRIIDSINPIIGDRPFAFLFFISTSTTYYKQKLITKRRTGAKVTSIDIYNTFNINYGMLGTRLGYEFQSFAHKNIVKGRPVDPKGWNHQISAGGHPTILFDYNRFRPLLSITTKPKPHKAEEETKNPVRIFDIGWNFGGSIGYYERVVTGLYARAGLLRTHNQARWNSGGGALNGASYQTFNTDAGQSEVIKKEKRTKPELFIYGRINTTMMLRNSLLVGQRFVKSAYTMESSWPKTALFEYEWGIVLSLETKKDGEQSARTWGLIYRTVYRSPEFDSKLFPVRWHYFGSMGFIFPVH